MREEKGGGGGRESLVRAATNRWQACCIVVFSKERNYVCSSLINYRFAFCRVIRTCSISSTGIDLKSIPVTE